MTESLERPATLPDAPWIRRFPVRTPTLPPATHTNVYIVGGTEAEGGGDLAVVDPATPYPDEQAALDASLDELADRGLRVREILLTHHHVDHVSGATHLASRLGVPIAAHRVTAELLAGRVMVSRTLEEGDRLSYGGVTLEALHTPGHAPGHLCYFDLRSRALLAGDMVASIGTIIVDPPEGDMRLYLESLARLRRLAPSWLLPSHGEPVADPPRLLDHYVAHRLDRERRVLTALANGAASVENLVPMAYPDISPFLYPLAARSLLAHLLKLRDEHRAVEESGAWRGA